jgi:hypothetical protein
MRATWTWLIPAVLAAGCHAKVKGSLQVDGTTFKVTECRSGRAFGFSGLQLGDDSGRHIRVLLQADGSATAAIFPPHAKRGDMLGACAELDLQTQHSRINNVQNVEGTVSLACKALGHDVRGKVTFENCH